MGYGNFLFYFFPKEITGRRFHGRLHGFWVLLLPIGLIAFGHLIQIGTLVGQYLQVWAYTPLDGLAPRLAITSELFLGTLM
jgi:hypothetical protein